MHKLLLIALCIAVAPVAARADHHDESKKTAAPAGGGTGIKDAAHTHDGHMGHEGKKGGKKFHCAECDMDMKSGGEMKAHMKEHHGMEGYCMKCSMGFKTSGEAKAHHKSAHGHKKKGGMKHKKAEPKN